MEVVELGQGGSKLRVLFGGAPLPCFHDSDCPGGGICALNKTWSAEPGGWCMCNTKAGLVGANCDEICAQGEAVLGINIVAAILSFLLVIASGVCVAFLVKYGGSFAVSYSRSGGRGSLTRNRKSVTPVFITMCFVLSGSVFLFISSVMSCVVSVGFPNVAKLYKDSIIPERYVRRVDPALDMAVHVTTALGHSLAICSTAVLPLTWINVAQRSLKLQSSHSSVIAVFSAVFILVTMCVEVSFYILAASDFGSEEDVWTTAAVICWGIIFFIIISLNLAALIKITQVKWTSLMTMSARYSRSTPTTNRSRSSSGQSLLVVSGDVLGMQRLITRIQVTCIMLIISSCAVMALMTFFTIRSARMIDDDPRCILDTNDLLYRSSVFVVLFACAICVWFVVPSVTTLRQRHKYRRSAGSSAFNNSSVIFGGSQFGSPVRGAEGTMHAHHYLFKSRANSKDTEGGNQAVGKDDNMSKDTEKDEDLDERDILARSSIERPDTVSPTNTFPEEGKTAVTPTRTDIPAEPSRQLILT